MQLAERVSVVGPTLDRAGECAGLRVLGFVACKAVVRRSAFLGCGGFHRHFGIGGEERLLTVD